MMIVKFTILLTMVCALFVFTIRVWGKSHPLEVWAEAYPTWFYIGAMLIYLDVICIFASAIWFLFFYL